MNYESTDEEVLAAVEAYMKMTDEELLEMIRVKTEELGHVPTKHDIPGAFYIKSRFGPWPRVLEAAGVKEVTSDRVKRSMARREKRNRLKEKSKE